MRIGIARRNIDPGQGTLLGGYPDVVRLSAGVHDSLHLSAVHIAPDEGADILIVAFDGLTVSPRLTAAVRKVMDEDTVIVVTTSHSHAAPSLPMPNWDQGAAGPADLNYEKHLAEVAVSAAMEARENALPGHIGVGSAVVDAPVGANRRHFGRSGDPRVRTLEFANDADDRVLLVIHGCHPTVLGPDNLLSSADLALGVRKRLAARGYVGAVQFIAGGAGDQSTRATRSASTFAEAERLGGNLADAAWGAMTEATISTGIHAAFGSATLPVRELADPAEAQQASAELDQLLHRRRSEGADLVELRSLEVLRYGRSHDLRRAQHWQDGMPRSPFDITALRFGDQTVVFAPVEPFLEIALELETRYGAWLVGYTNDYRGYLLPDSEIAVGGYELAASPFGPGAWQAMETALAPLIDLVAGTTAGAQP